MHTVDVLALTLALIETVTLLPLGLLLQVPVLVQTPACTEPQVNTLLIFYKYI
jgi:hypothetical protein